MIEDVVRDIEKWSLYGDNEEVMTSAIQLCKIDFMEFGEDWMSWSNHDIVDCYVKTIEETLDDILYQLEAQNAGEQLIDDLLNCPQDERIDYMRVIRGMRSGVENTFLSLFYYFLIHEDIQKKYGN